jgi:hypothetical protein
MSRGGKTPDDWTSALSADELAFVRKFLLASGSLKELAGEYEVSYPTIRLRLDALIDKVRALGPGAPPSALRLAVRRMVAEGELEIDVARKLLKAHDEDMERKE